MQASKVRKGRQTDEKSKQIVITGTKKARWLDTGADARSRAMKSKGIHLVVNVLSRIMQIYNNYYNNHNNNNDFRKVLRFERC